MNIMVDLTKKRVNILNHLEFNPTVIYDIGAHKGLWTQEFQNYFISSKFVLFEADSAHEADLKATNCDYHIQLLADKNEEREFFQSTSQFSTGNSMYRENTEVYTDKYIRKIKLPATTLDEFVAKRGIPLPDMMKLDVQGAEMEILNGASNVLKNVKIIMLELSILPYNSGAPDYLTMLNFMRDLGFEMYDIFHIHYYHGIMSQIDVIFARKDTNMRPQVENGILQNITGLP